jgi:hypothetical protein
MAARLNTKGKNFAKKLIASGAVNRVSGCRFLVEDESKNFGDPENLNNYGRSFLGLGLKAEPKTKALYEYPFAKTSKGKVELYRSAIVAIRQKAGQQKDTTVFNSAGDLLDLIDKKEVRKVDGESVSVRKLQMPSSYIRGIVIPESVDEKNRRLQITWTTGAAVLRKPFFDEPFWEELSLKKDHVRMERMQTGAPFIRRHRAHDVEDILGVLEDVKLTSQKGTAWVRFSEREEVEPVWRDYATGIITSCSVEYLPWKFLELKPRDGVKVLRAIDWEPFAVAGTLVGADAGANTRSFNEIDDNVDENNNDVNYYDVEIISKTGLTNLEGRGMNLDEQGNLIDENGTVLLTAKQLASVTPEQIRALVTAPVVAPVVAPTIPPAVAPIVAPAIEPVATNDASIREAAAVTERTRILDINTAARAFSYTDEIQIGKFISEGKSAEAFRKLIQDGLVKDDKENPGSHVSPVTLNNERNIKMREAATNALCHRAMPDKFDLSEDGKDFAYTSLLDLARTHLEMNGMSLRGMPAHMIADIALNNPSMRGMHTTTDFPAIVLDAANKFLAMAYAEAPSTYGPFTKDRFVNDFKNINIIQKGDAPALLKVKEDGKVQHGTMSDAKEVYHLDTYARILAITRKTIMDDDLNVFASLAQDFGVASRSLESDLVWWIFLNNPLMGDGKALFHADHGNLGSGAIDITGLDVGRQKMRSQVGLDGRILNIVPAWLIVSSLKETLAEQYTSQIVPNDPTKVNPYGPGGRTRLLPIVEPRLDQLAAGVPWFLAADKVTGATVEIARLTGTTGPQTFTRDGFDVEGVEMKVRHDVAAKALNWRSIYKSSGV